MKKILMLSLLATLTAGMRAEDEGTAYLVFTLTDGTTRSITTEGLKLSFADGDLTATNGANSLTIALTSLQKMVFSNDSTTRIEGAETTGDDADEAVYYDLQGHKVNLNVNVNVKKGVYIVKTKNRTYKTTVK